MLLFWYYNYYIHNNVSGYYYYHQPNYKPWNVLMFEGNHMEHIVRRSTSFTHPYSIYTVFLFCFSFIGCAVRGVGKGHFSAKKGSVEVPAHVMAWVETEKNLWERLYGRFTWERRIPLFSLSQMHYQSFMKCTEVLSLHLATPLCHGDHSDS